jgi:Carboxypeptidase regulatory-like domain
MRNRTHSGLLLLMLASVLVGCDDGRRSGPNGPSTTAQQPYTLFGAVSEMTADGSSPIEGAQVIVVRPELADPSSGRIAMTDSNGFYSIPGLPRTTRSIVISKPGYVSETKLVSMSSDTKLDVELERVEGHILSGVVFEVTDAGEVPIEGVELYCDSCGSPDGHTFVNTDANGFYSLAYSNNGSHPLLVTKAGYQIFDPTGKLLDQYGWITATVRGDTRFNIQLARR